VAKPFPDGDARALAASVVGRAGVGVPTAGSRGWRAHPSQHGCVSGSDESPSEWAHSQPAAQLLPPASMFCSTGGEIGGGKVPRSQKWCFSCSGRHLDFHI